MPSRPPSPRSPPRRASCSRPLASTSRKAPTAGRRVPAPAGIRTRTRTSRQPPQPPGERRVSPWWVRPGLDIAEGRLRIAGRDAEALAREHGTPLFVYDRARFAENARELQGALARTGLPFRVRFALKANPLPEVLEVFRALGAPGDAGSVGHRCLLARRGRTGDGVWLARRRDQLHGDERLRARPRRPPGRRRPPQPRRHQPDRAVRPACAGNGDRHPDRPGRGRRVQRPPPRTPATGRPSSGSGSSGSTTPCRPLAGTT